MDHTFASDNTAPLCPEAFTALEAANAGALPSYGDDPLTARAQQAVRAVFEKDCAVYFVSTGTAANALGLRALCRPYHAIVCHDQAHLETDECGAAEFFTGGGRLLGVEGEHGKLTPDSVEAAVTARAGDVHFSKPAVVSLTQSTETGTVYAVDEVAAIATVARRHGLRVHVDGARFANAVAATGAPPRALTWEAGVDVLSFGGSKNGIALAEAVVFFDPELARDFDYVRKQGGQLTSKMRYLAAPWAPVLESGVWLRNARAANESAARLAAGLRDLPGVRIVHPVDANAVFVDLAPGLHRALSERWAYHPFEGSGFRFMCSWQTKPEQVEALLADARRLADPRR